MDPLATKTTTSTTITTQAKPQIKTPQAFLGENSSLVNLDYLIKPNITLNTNGTNSNLAYNPFSDSIAGTTAVPQRTNLFQQQHQPVSIID